MDLPTAAGVNALAVMDRALLCSPEAPFDSVEKIQQLNRAGFLTTRTVAGHRTGDRDERALLEGFMPKAAARAFAEAVNTTTDKIAVVVHPEHRRSALQIPVVFEDGVGREGADLCRRPAQIAALRHSVGLCGSADAAYVLCLDTLWGRPAAGPEGLLSDCLAVLASL